MSSMGNETKQDDDKGRFDSSKPHFRKPSSKSSKVVLDERFSSVLTDSRFQLDVKDKYGRKSKKTSKKQKAKEDLGAFYTIAEDDDDEKNGAAKPEWKHDDRFAEAKDAKAGGNKPKKEAKSVLNAQASEDPASRIAYLTALSRGELDVSSSSSSEDSSDSDGNSSDSDSDEDLMYGAAGVLDPTTHESPELTTESSPYLAVMDMDWENVRAVDIFSILSSFAPPGAVRRVAVYPSDFGMEQMSKDEMYGPTNIWKKEKNKSAKASQLVKYESDDESSSNVSSNDSVNEDGDSFQAVDGISNTGENSNKETDFDQEKLRAYEASKLKYYFAVVEFAKAEYADIAYKEVDGMEFEHSSAAIDLRAIPVDSLSEVIQDRDVRDEARSIPSNYDPPEFVINALQQSSVQCTWDTGDLGREQLLTKYSVGEKWEELAKGDNLKVYLASDHSSDEGSDVENAKASSLRKMLGLDSDEDEDNDVKVTSKDKDSELEDEHDVREAKFVPGRGTTLVDESTNLSEQELTPWEKYKEKRKQKKREKRQAAREKRKQVNERRKNDSNSTESDRDDDDDDFFVGQEGTELEENDSAFKHQSKEELELLIAGDEEKDDERDYNMRGLERVEKNKDKKLRGARKRKEDKVAANVTGTDFQVDIADDRFKAVLDGSDSRYGIDRTDPNFKDTTAMREILKEQSKRRRKKRKTKSDPVPDVDADATPRPSSGAAALSALISSIKEKVK